MSRDMPRILVYTIVEMSLNTLKNKINKILMSSYKDTGEKSDESTSNASASFTCEECGKTFNSRQELKEHTLINTAISFYILFHSYSLTLFVHIEMLKR
jgi:hypothetical protein